MMLDAGDPASERKAGIIYAQGAGMEKRNGDHDSKNGRYELKREEAAEDGTI